MLRLVLIGIAAVVVLVATRPATFRIERSISIAAPPQMPFAQVNDLRAWGAWSPYERKDPQMTRTFAGPPAGPGAVYAWSGNQEVGKGRMTIVRSDEPSEVAIALEFLEPFTATNTATFTFAPVPGGTRVTWAMDGRNGFLGKAISLVMDMDTMVGGDFEKGLAALKTVSESRATANAAVR